MGAGQGRDTIAYGVDTVGSEFADGGPGADRLAPFSTHGDGGLTAVGRAGNDRLLGDSGRDDLGGGTGADQLDGGDGTTSGGPGRDRCGGGPQLDTATRCEVTTAVP